MSQYGTHPEYEYGFNDGLEQATDKHRELIQQCEGLIAAIHAIVENWKSGDLAGAVNIARELSDDAEDFIVNHCGEA